MVTNFDLQAAAYSNIAAITDDYILDSVSFDFNTTEVKTIRITD
jgi:hypothetical protein